MGAGVGVSLTLLRAHTHTPGRDFSKGMAPRRIWEHSLPGLPRLGGGQRSGLDGEPLPPPSSQQRVKPASREAREEPASAGMGGSASSLSPLSLGEQPGCTDRPTNRLPAGLHCLGGADTRCPGPTQPSLRRRAPPRPVGADGSFGGTQSGGRRVELRSRAT